MLALVLFGCGPAPTPTPPPTPRILQVQVTPALQSLADGFAICAEEQPGLGLVTLETPADALDPATSLALRWGPGPDLPASAAVIGEERLVIVVHSRNPRSSISLEELRALYRGEGQASAWAYPAGDDVQRVFESAVMEGTPVPTRAVSLAPHPAAMREAVAGALDGVGFLPERWLDDSVKAIPVDGLEPSRLAAPVLALRNSEPKGPEKTWLLCLQAVPPVYNKDL